MNLLNDSFFAAKMLVSAENSQDFGHLTALTDACARFRQARLALPQVLGIMLTPFFASAEHRRHRGTATPAGETSSVDAEHYSIPN
jgi:hypothetical protein